jgi:sugar-phosphatase
MSDLVIPVAGLLFDNDGVLVDSHGAAVDAWDKWSAKYAPNFDWSDRSNAGIRAEDMVRRHVEEDRYDEAVAYIHQLEQDSAHLTRPLPGAVELLTSLTPGMWTVCTSANPRLGAARLRAAGLPVPAELVSSEDVERGKPHPDPYQRGAQNLGLSAGECIVFEDAAAGIQAGLSAGAAQVIGVTQVALDTDVEIVVKNLEGVSYRDGALHIPASSRLR